VYRDVVPLVHSANGLVIGGSGRVSRCSSAGAFGQRPCNRRQRRHCRLARCNDSTRSMKLRSSASNASGLARPGRANTCAVASCVPSMTSMLRSFSSFIAAIAPRCGHGSPSPICSSLVRGRRKNGNRWRVFT
jgi:hypothetical protein